MATVGCCWVDAGSAVSASPEPRRSDAMAAAPRARWCCFVSAARTRPRPSLDWRRWAVAGQTLDPRDQRLPSLDAPTRWPPRLASLVLFYGEDRFWCTTRPHANLRHRGARGRADLLVRASRPVADTPLPAMVLACRSSVAPMEPLAPKGADRVTQLDAPPCRSS